MDVKHGGGRFVVIFVKFEIPGNQIYLRCTSKMYCEKYYVGTMNSN